MDKPLIGARRHISWHSTDLTNGISSQKAEEKSARNIRSSMKVVEEDLGFSIAEVQRHRIILETVKYELDLLVGEVEVRCEEDKKEMGVEISQLMNRLKYLIQEQQGENGNLSRGITETRRMKNKLMSQFFETSKKAFILEELTSGAKR